MIRITEISQLQELLYDSSETIQRNIKDAEIDSDAKYLLDSISQQTHYVLSGIIEYLENL